MKTGLKSFLVLSLGIAGLVTATSLLAERNAALSGDRAPANLNIIQSAEAAESQGTLVAQVGRGNALAAELQGKPTVVKIYADWCPACQRLRPVTNSLQQQFNGRANFVIFDVSNRNTTQAAEARAKQLGLSNFLSAHRTQTSTVAVINPSNGQILNQFRYNFDQQDYTNAINRAIAQTRPRT